MPVPTVVTTRTLQPTDRSVSIMTDLSTNRHPIGHYETVNLPARRPASRVRTAGSARHESGVLTFPAVCGLAEAMSRLAERGHPCYDGLWALLT